MASTRFHFRALLANVNPSPSRRELAKTLPGEVREWLAAHDFPTVFPHTRLTGSYARQVAVGEIKDVDVLLFVEEEEREQKPNSILIRIKKLLDEYPDTVLSDGQHRSVRLVFPAHDLHLDIVPAIAPESLDEPLEVPDRPTKTWIASDPLNYGERLSAENASHGMKLVPLIKLVKAWRDQNFAIRRPKSYVLEVIVFRAMTGGHLIWENCSTGQLLHGFFDHVAEKWKRLMDEGERSPKVRDPQLDNVISGSWERSHFETFMRRVREARTTAARALQAEETDDLDTAVEEWKSLFGDFWPTAEQVEELMTAQARDLQPGKARISSSGLVGGSAGVASRGTRYYGGRR
jgi:hypothetical protein